MDTKRPTPRHIITTLSTSQRNNLESSKTKVTRHVQGSSHKTVREFLDRNITGQKGVKRHFQNAERKKNDASHEYHIPQQCPSEMKEK